MLRGFLRIGLLAVGLAALQNSPVDAQLLSPFQEPEDGREPITSALGSATQTIDLYSFILTLPDDDPVVAALGAAAAAGVEVRAVLEPCPGEGATCNPPNADAVSGCEILIQAGVSVKWANPAFIKTHAKTVLIDNTRALVTTINLEPPTFTVRRDYGVYTDDAGIASDLRQVFDQDWQEDPLVSDCNEPPRRSPDETVQSYSTLVVTPDNARDALIGSPGASGIIGAAASSLLIQMEKLDPQTSRGVIPALRDAVLRGVTVQVLLKEGTGSLEQANAVIAAGGEALCQRNLHAKLIIADGAQLFLGSQNLTRDSLDLRREIGWITADPEVLSRFGGTFASDWDSAQDCTR